VPGVITCRGAGPAACAAGGGALAVPLGPAWPARQAAMEGRAAIAANAVSHVRQPDMDPLEHASAGGRQGRTCLACGPYGPDQGQCPQGVRAVELPWFVGWLTA